MFCMPLYCVICDEEADSEHEMIKHLMTHSSVLKDFLTSPDFVDVVEEYESLVIEWYVEDIDEETGEKTGELICTECGAIIKDNWYDMVEHIVDSHAKEFWENIGYWFGDDDFYEFVKENLDAYVYKT